MPWNLDDPGLPGVVEAAEPQACADERRQVRVVQPVGTVVPLGPAAWPDDRGGQCARHDHDRVLVPDQRALQRHYQQVGKVGLGSPCRQVLRVLHVAKAARVAGVLKHRVLEAPAGAEIRDALLAGGPHGSDRALLAGVRRSRHQPYRVEPAQVAGLRVRVGIQ